MRKQELLKLIQDQQAEIDLLKHRLSILELSPRTIYQPPIDKPWWASPYKITMTSDTEGILTVGNHEANEVLSYDKMLEGLDGKQGSYQEIANEQLKPSIKDSKDVSLVYHTVNLDNPGEEDFLNAKDRELRMSKVIKKQNGIQLGVDRDH